VVSPSSGGNTSTNAVRSRTLARSRPPKQRRPLSMSRLNDLPPLSHTWISNQPSALLHQMFRSLVRKLARAPGNALALRAWARM